MLLAAWGRGKATHWGKDAAHAADSKLHEVGHKGRLTSLNPYRKVSGNRSTLLPMKPATSTWRTRSDGDSAGSQRRAESSCASSPAR